MSDRREETRQGIVLRPGIALPALGYAGSLIVVVLAMIAVVHPGPPNHSLGARWVGGQILVTGVWLLYKFASQRIILTSDAMRVVSFFQIWNVRRGGVQETDPEDRSFALVIALTDGSTIDPLMFWTNGRAPFTRNAMSRQTISDRIKAWNADALPDTASEVGPLAWRQIRLNLSILLALSAIVAVEAITLTAAGIW